MAKRPRSRREDKLAANRLLIERYVRIVYDVWWVEAEIDQLERMLRVAHEIRALPSIIQEYEQTLGRLNDELDELRRELDPLHDRFAGAVAHEDIKGCTVVIGGNFFVIHR